MRRAWILLLAANSACTHVSHARTHASARLDSIKVVGAQPGELQLLARYQLDGLPYGAWRGDAAQLSLTLNDVPFASVVAEPRVLAGDIVEVPVGLAFTRPPREAATAWLHGDAVRVRLRGRMVLTSKDSSERIPTDVEAELVLPTEALPPPPRI